MKTMNKKYIYAALVALLIVLSPILIHAVREFGACGSTAKGSDESGMCEAAETDNCVDPMYDFMEEDFEGEYEVLAEAKSIDSIDTMTNRMGSSETEMPAKKIIENYELRMQSKNFDSAVTSITAVAIVIATTCQ